MGHFFSTLLMDSIFKHNSGVQGQTLLFATLAVISVLALTIGFNLANDMDKSGDVLRGSRTDLLLFG